MFLHLLSYNPFYWPTDSTCSGNVLPQSHFGKAGIPPVRNTRQEEPTFPLRQHDPANRGFLHVLACCSSPAAPFGFSRAFYCSFFPFLLQGLLGKTLASFRARHLFSHGCKLWMLEACGIVCSNIPSTSHQGCCSPPYRSRTNAGTPTVRARALLQQVFCNCRQFRLLIAWRHFHLHRDAVQ